MMLNFMTSPSFGQGNGFRLLMGALLFAPAIACAGNRFPAELVGSWDLGPEPCRLPLNPDADSPIRIEGRQVLRYEDIDTARRIKRVSTMPMAWQVVATSAAAPDVVTHDLYVVEGDSLTVTNGSEAVKYRRCAASNP